MRTIGKADAYAKCAENRELYTEYLAERRRHELQTAPFELLQSPGGGRLVCDGWLACDAIVVWMMAFWM
jgi:hypothetical protein